MDHVSLYSRELTPETIRGYDCVVVVTDHTVVDFDMIAREAVLVVDCRNAIRSKASNVIKL
jgi:UDP-N-acetyl-D-glucosamine dehydrogenase